MLADMSESARHRFDSSIVSIFILHPGIPQCLLTCCRHYRISRNPVLPGILSFYVKIHVHVLVAPPEPPLRSFRAHGRVQCDLRITAMCTLPTMSCHPDEPLIEIVGIECSTNGRSCEEHNICGAVLSIDCVVRFRTIQTVNGK